MCRTGTARRSLRCVNEPMALKQWNGDKIIAISQRATDAALVKVAAMIVRDAADPRNCPVGITGQLARSIGFGSPQTRANRRLAEIGFTGGNRGSFYKYAMAMERGRAPGKGVPPGALNLWVRRKLGITDEKEIRSVAYLISRSIKRHGITGRHFMYNAFTRHARKLPPEIVRYHKAMLKELK